MAEAKRVYTFDIPCSDLVLSALTKEKFRLYVEARLRHALLELILESGLETEEEFIHGTGSGVPIGIIGIGVKG